MPTPVCSAASTPSTAAPGYCWDPVITPSTPRLYLSSWSPGTAMRVAASSAVQSVKELMAPTIVWMV